MVGDNGKPTRLALSAAAWGEPVPKNRSDAAKLAAKGRRLLQRYENTKKKKKSFDIEEVDSKNLGTTIGQQAGASGGGQPVDGDGDGYVASIPGGPDETPVRKKNQAPAVRGQIEKGNIDLNNRPVVRNSDGSISTVRSISITEGKATVLIPTVIRDKKGRGKVVSDRDAIRHYQRSGEHLGKFSSSGDADKYAEQLHNQQAAQYTGKSLK